MWLDELYVGDPMAGPALARLLGQNYRWKEPETEGLEPCAPEILAELSSDI